jgi:hypothetical protein
MLRFDSKLKLYRLKKTECKASADSADLGDGRAERVYSPHTEKDLNQDIVAAAPRVSNHAFRACANSTSGYKW